MFKGSHWLESNQKMCQPQRRELCAGGDFNILYFLLLGKKEKKKKKPKQLHKLTLNMFKYCLQRGYSNRFLFQNIP